MTTITLIILLFATGCGGLVLGYILRWAIAAAQRGSVELQVQQTLLEAKEKAQKITEEAAKTAEEIERSAKQKEEEKEQQLKKVEDRLLKKDETLDKRQEDLDREIDALKTKVDELRSVKDHVERQREQAEKELSRIASLSPEEAHKELLVKIEEAHEEDFLVRIQKLEMSAQEKLERRAKDILTSIIQRLAVPTNSENMATPVLLPSEDLKGKIIGKEGRNIRTFERTAGVEVIIDDTPGSIVISSFDPVRRATAKRALEMLIADGRIQPAKIEEAVEKAREDVSKIIKEKGEAAVYECGIVGLDPRIVAILGRLHFRTSYGQNVLQHSIEMAHLAGMLAEELGADPMISRAGALLHDIGKAVDHEIQGTHVEIGRRILQKFGADSRIIQAMQAHHEEYPYETLESIIVQTADSISGGRPGARRDSVENYLKRLGDLEAITLSFPGVEKSYAIAAGREIRIFVNPEQITDLEAHTLAREIAKRVEQELKYPGEIKINVIRESRVIEYAR
jgi:ribonuclease Y